MKKKHKVLISAAFSGILMAACETNSQKKKSGPKSAMGECHEVNKCKGSGDCGGKGYSCAGNNACKGKGWLRMNEAECKEKGGRFKG